MKKFLSICFVLMIAIMPIKAQEEELGVEGPDPGGVPVDGGLSLLLVAGVAYGAHRRRRRA
jgi:hypothetical protein